MTIPPLLAHWQLQLTGMAATGEQDGAHDAQHLHRVWHNAQALLAHHRAADALVVLAACYLHDLVNLPKDHPERHLASRRSAVLACQQLALRNFPADKLSAVGHAIEAHSFSAGIAPRTLEAKLVQDADRLDALGAVGLARLFYTAGRMGSALAHGADPLGINRPLDDRRYALDHIALKLDALPESMQTAAGRALGHQRLAALNAFRTQFAEEWTPPKAAPGASQDRR